MTSLVQTALEQHRASCHFLDRPAKAPPLAEWPRGERHELCFQGAPAIPYGPQGSPVQKTMVAPQSTTVPMDWNHLTQWLDLSLGVTATAGPPNDPYPLRSHPSSGNLHPVEAYLIIPGGHPQPAGVYHFQGIALQLTKRTQSIELPPGPILLGLSLLPKRQAWRYGDRGYRYSLLDLGHAIGALAHGACSWGWQLHPVQPITDDTLHRALGSHGTPGIALRLSQRTENESDNEQGIELLERLAQLGPQQWVGIPEPRTQDDFEWPFLSEQIRSTKRHSRPTARPLIKVPRHWVGNQECRQTMRKRRSAVSFDAHSPLATNQMKALLTVCGEVLPGSLKLQLLIHRVEGYTPGIYRYSTTGPLAPNHAPELLEPIEQNQLRNMTGCFAARQEIAIRSALSIIIHAPLQQTLEENGSAHYRELLLDTGILGYSFYLTAQAYGFGVRGIGAFYDSRFPDLLGAHDHQPLYLMSFGNS
ncbi:MAG: nitroreductase family protein [Myxococcota bacterium]|nr:nitroreductase family protein [Myxococcota bacterium]